jgi:dethiobiotin synthetase
VRGLFVTATDTDVGKSVLAASLIAAIAAAGEPVRAFKPAVSGLDSDDETACPAAPSSAGAWPADHELLGAAAGMDPDEVAPYRYGPAVSPHLGAELAGERIEASLLVDRARASAREATLIAEGVGGLLVPLTDELSVCDLAVALGLPLLIAARPGLGTINHTLLTLAAARAAALDVRAIVLTPWPPQPSAIERSNRETIARLGDVEVATLAPVATPATNDLARAGQTLPWRRWLG